MSDQRVFNKRGGPSIQHKLRVIVGTKQNPIAYGMTFPKSIAMRFSGCSFIMSVSGNSIILTSGCITHLEDLSYKEAEEWRKSIQSAGGEIELQKYTG
ncbi:MAG: hypothetical protein ACTSXD_11835 [Candidatus Heimdallarchaeaceae archaeon]